ncbi:hypothetical protein [Kiloniella sp.]|uniref:hypothetical protein n=1 Tax=Kiloniella sp. TaxID=1938587 RepID=UPI003A94476D
MDYITIIDAVDWVAKLVSIKFPEASLTAVWLLENAVMLTLHEVRFFLILL